MLLGETVCVVGAGAVGLLAMQAARAAGALAVFVVERSTARKKLAAELGAVTADHLEHIDREMACRVGQAGLTVTLASTDQSHATDPCSQTSLMDRKHEELGSRSLPSSSPLLREDYLTSSIGGVTSLWC